MADLREKPSPILQLIAERLAVDGDHQSTIRDPGADQFDGLLGFRDTIRDIEFQGPFGVLQIAHVNGAFNTRYRGGRANLVGAGRYRKGVACSAVLQPKMQGLRGLSRRYDFIVAADVAEHIARDFFDQIGIGDFRREQSHVAPQFRADGFEAPVLEIEKRRSFDEARPRFKSMPAVAGMIDEIGRRRQAGKQHEYLPGEMSMPISPFRPIGTQH